MGRSAVLGVRIVIRMVKYAFILVYKMGGVWLKLQLTPGIERLFYIQFMQIKGWAKMQTRPIQRRKHKTPWALLFVMLTTIIGVLVLGTLVGAYVVYSTYWVPMDVTVAGVPVGGKTISSAEDTLIKNNPRQNVLLTDGDRSWAMALSDLGIAVDVESTIEAAQKSAMGSDVQPRYWVDLNQTQQGLVGLREMVNIPAVPGNSPQMGRAMEIPVLLDRLRVNLTQELADGVIELPMIEVEPPPLESINRSDTARSTHIVEAGQELALIARMYGVSVDDIVNVNDLADPNVLAIGQQLTIPADGLYLPAAGEAPPAPIQSGKAIVVSTGDQRIYAYENGELVHSHLVSTGLPETPTVLGDYNIYVKYEATDMRGEDYYLPDVPYTMYFYQGYGIHGTYWHNSFGRPMSHGCVNLPTPEAQWFFNWAEVGTLVRVI